MTGHGPRRLPGVAAAVIVRDSRVLLVRRRVREGDLSWQFPAGGIEPGESAERAAVREAAEETGLTVGAVRLLGRRVHPLTGRAVSYVACEVRAGVACAGTAAADAGDEETAEVAWAAREEIPRYVPYGLFDPVQAWLDARLRDSG